MRVVWSNQNSKQGEGMENKDLIKFFDRTLFIPKLKAKTKDETFKEFANLFVESKYIRNKGIVIEMLQKRETLGSTGIGKNIAIPHGRTTAALDVRIAFGKSEKGIEFDAIDKKPVNLIFVVLAPPQEENNRYLPVLGKLVEVLNDKKNRKKLLEIESFEELVQTIKEAK